MENIFIIDLDRLDEHWKEQPELMRKYGELAAKARLEYERTQAELTRLDAKLDSEIRKNPEHFLAGKPTESAISKAIELHADHKRMVDAVIEARYKMERLKAIVTALDHRKTALENLVKLHGQQYFALPNVKTVDLREIDKAIAREKIKKAMQKTNKKTEV